MTHLKEVYLCLYFRQNNLITSYYFLKENQIIARVFLKKLNIKSDITNDVDALSKSILLRISIPQIVIRNLTFTHSNFHLSTLSNKAKLYCIVDIIDIPGRPYSEIELRSIRN